jgi:Glycosyltransferase family 28 N-terminal domain
MKYLSVCREVVRTRCVPHLPNHSDTSGRVASDLGSYSCQSATRVFGSSANSLNGSGSASCPPLWTRFVRMRRIASIQKAPHRRVIESVGRTQAKTQGPITMRRKRILFATLGSLGDLYPYLAVASEMQRRGHQATILTGSQHQSRIESWSPPMKAAFTCLPACCRTSTRFISSTYRKGSARQRSR